MNRHLTIAQRRPDSLGGGPAIRKAAEPLIEDGITRARCVYLGNHSGSFRHRSRKPGIGGVPNSFGWLGLKNQDRPVAWERAIRCFACYGWAVEDGRRKLVRANPATNGWKRRRRRSPTPRRRSSAFGRVWPSAAAPRRTTDKKWRSTSRRRALPARILPLRGRCLAAIRGEINGISSIYDLRHLRAPFGAKC